MASNYHASSFRPIPSSRQDSKSISVVSLAEASGVNEELVSSGPVGGSQHKDHQKMEVPP